MLDLVPFTGSRWKVAHAQAESDLVGQFLEGHLPQARTAAIAAAAVGGDQQFAGARKTLAAHVLVPAADGSRCEEGHDVINADAHPALGVGHILASLRNG